MSEQEEKHVSERIEAYTAEIASLKAINAGLLAACEEAMEFLSKGSPIYSGSFCQETIEAAIAKARGIQA